MIGERFQPRGDDDSIAKQIVAFGYHLALMHPDPKFQPTLLGVQFGLNGDGAL
jgi:hypothetical protein